MLFMTVLVSIKALAASPIFDVIDSDVLNPQQHKVKFQLAGITQSSPNRIDLEKIHLVMKDNSLGDLSAQRMLSGVGLNRNELYAIQLLFTAQKVFNFYDGIGRPLPDIIINMQDPSLGYGVGGQAGGQTSLMDIKDSNDFHGGTHAFEEFIPFMSDILSHEISHHAQRTYVKDPTNDPSNPSYIGRLGLIAIEGHANLMAWLITGSSVLGRPESLSDSRSIVADVSSYKAIFGRVSDAYDSYIPFASVLVSIHDKILSQEPDPQRKINLHKAISQIYFQIFTDGKSTDTFQDLANQTLDRLTGVGLVDKNLRTDVEKEFLTHGLDVHLKVTEGYTKALVIDGFAADRTVEVWRTQLRTAAQQGADLLAQDGFFSNLRPMTANGVTVGMSMGSCLQNEYSKWLTSFPAGGPPSQEDQQLEIEKLYFQCGQSDVDPGGVIIKNSTFTLIPSHAEIYFQTVKSVNQSMCIDGFVFANLLIYSQQGEQLSDLQFPFRCVQ